jgi:hypothetical protein
MIKNRFSSFILILAIGFTASGPAAADKIRHPTAVFSGLDKITGRIISFEVATDETVQFGTLQITERVCYTRPATEAPQTTTFIEVEEVDAAGEYKRIFSGWMFASSPGLNAIEHPVYDIWLTDCKGNGDLIASAPDSTDAEQIPPPPPPNAAPATAEKPKPKVKPRKVEPVEPTLTGEPGETPPPGLAPPGNIPNRRQSQQRYAAPPPQPQPPQQRSFWDSLRSGF